MGDKVDPSSKIETSKPDSSAPPETPGRGVELAQVFKLANERMNDPHRGLYVPMSPSTTGASSQTPDDEPPKMPD